LNKILKMKRQKNLNNPEVVFEFVNQNVSDKKFNEIDFSHLTIRAVTMDSCIMVNCDYEIGSLTHSIINYSNFTGTNLSGLFLETCSFSECEFEYCDFTNASFFGITFHKCKFKNINFDLHQNSNVIFDNCEFIGCYNLHKLPTALSDIVSKKLYKSSACLLKHVKDFNDEESLIMFKSVCRDELSELCYIWKNVSQLKDYKNIKKFFECCDENWFHLLKLDFIKDIPDRERYIEHLEKVYYDGFVIYNFIYKSNVLSIEDKNNLKESSICSILVIVPENEKFQEENIWNEITKTHDDFLEKIKFIKMSNL